MKLLIELRDGEQWKPIGSMRPGEPAGSMSNDVGGRRDIIQFSISEDGSALIERSDGGVDAEVGRLRAMVIQGFTRVARPWLGESHTMEVQTDRMPRSATIRFRYVR